MSKLLSSYWSISINGSDIGDKRKYVQDISFEDLCDGSNTCTISIADPDMVFIEDNIFIEEVAISVTYGWNEDIYRINFDGYISAIDINFPETGSPVLSIFCLDESHMMNRNKNKRSWDNTTNAQVVQSIALEYGFKVVIEQGYEFKSEDTITQSNTTDIAFCESLAESEREPFMCKLIGDTLYYVKKGVLQEPSSTLYYRKFPYDIKSFAPQINKETREEEISVADINTETKIIDSAVASDSNTLRDTQGDPVKTSDYSKYFTFSGEDRDWSDYIDSGE